MFLVCIEMNANEQSEFVCACVYFGKMQREKEDGGWRVREEYETILLTTTS